MLGNFGVLSFVDIYLFITLNMDSINFLIPFFERGKYTDTIMLLSDSREQKKVDYTELQVTIPGHVIQIEGGEFYRATKALKELLSNSGEFCERYQNLFNIGSQGFRVNDDFRNLLKSSPTETVFLDIETTGFSNTPLFLIGLLYFDGNDIVIDQLFARDYSEEAYVLGYFSEFITNFRMLVTFNGKSFDVPFIRDRMTYHRKVLKRTPIHVDILHHSRRRWKGKTPDCRLQTLEDCICGRRRDEDIPSAMVPEIYREFVRSGRTQFLTNVFHHNALDLITLCELTLVLLTEEI